MTRTLIRIVRYLFALLVLAAISWQLFDKIDVAGFSVVNFFSFFTILSNMLAAGVFLAQPWSASREHLASLLRGAAVVYMATTGVVYALLLAPLEANVGITAPWVDAVLHQIMPIAVVLDWLLVPPRNKLPRKAILVWMTFPVVYLAYSLVRGHFTTWYPYPFLNPSNEGYAQVALYAVLVAGIIGLVTVATRWAGNNLKKPTTTKSAKKNSRL